MADREPTKMSIADGNGKTIYEGDVDDFDRRVDAFTFSIPTPNKFDGAEFLPAPDLKKIGTMLIERYPADFEFLGDANIIYLWKEKGGDTGGRATLGKCIRPTGLARYFAAESFGGGERVDYFIWAAADHLLVSGARYRDICALVFHELKHADRDEKGKFIVVGHEFEGFAREIEEFGMWQGSIRKIAEACQTIKDVQQGLFDQ